MSELLEATGHAIARRRLTYRARRAMAVLGGAVAGLGLGIALAWAIGIFQDGSPQQPRLHSSGQFVGAYPAMTTTVFVVILAGLLFGLGIGTAVAAVIRPDERR